MSSSSLKRRFAATLAVGATTLGLVTFTSAPAQAAAICGGDVSVYGTLADGRLTYTAISPNTGNRVKTLIGPNLGFTPKAMATLNFNTVLVTSTAGELYRVDVQTNDNALAATATRIWDGGWTFDKMTYDGAGHLYGTVAGQLHRYNVSQAKPSGPAHIAKHAVIDEGFVLKTLAAAGDDVLIASTADGRLLSYQINGVGDWERSDLKSDGWSAVDSLVSPGGGLYYGRTNGGMYWYHDADPTDGKGSDIAYHSDDPVDASGWTQTLLSAFANDCTYRPPTPPTPTPSTRGGQIARSEVMNRAANWLARDVPYNQGASASDPDGDHHYRTDCSGFVSMVWHADTSYTTGSLPGVSSTISKSDLQPGDALNTQDGHVVLFEKWVDKAAGKFSYIHEANTRDDMMRGQDYLNGGPDGNIAGHAASGYIALRYDKVVNG
ncbi:tachylectin-related carbohydrate-binding protein [Streptomyces sp. NRRL S-448]|uniref:tachylectin-related carbohydrate-binding protein n=1 Tax=Streptomyces sp. NRRL S-448 TaxID=1463907 RepID=UPI0035641CA0